MINFFRILKFAIRDFSRNFWLSFNTISIILLSILSVNFLVVVSVVVNEAVRSVENRVSVSVYFNEKASLDQVEQIRAQLESEIDLKSASVITPTEAMNRFRERYADDDNIIAALDELSENPFSYSLVIQAKELDSYKLVSAVLNEPAYTQLIEQQDLSDLESHERAIARVDEISDKAKQIGLIITLILVFNSIVVVLNAIRLNIYSHREEISIMKLVGAKNWMVRGPFLIESMLYALFGVVAASALIYTILTFIDPQIPNLLGQPFSILSYYEENWVALILWQIVGIFAITMFSSALAMRRYLKT